MDHIDQLGVRGAGGGIGTSGTDAQQDHTKEDGVGEESGLHDCSLGGGGVRLRVFWFVASS